LRAGAAEPAECHRREAARFMLSLLNVSIVAVDGATPNRRSDMYAMSSGSRIQEHQRHSTLRRSNVNESLFQPESPNRELAATT